MSETDAQIQNEMQALNEPTIEFFILSDYAEAVNGKLYLMGGGWDRVLIQDFGKPFGFSFALGILVPWNATNIRQSVEISIEDPDGQKPVILKMGANFVTGRPPFIAQGAQQRTMLAIPRLETIFPGPGDYQAVARLSSGHERRVQFALMQAPSVQIPR